MTSGKTDKLRVLLLLLLLLLFLLFVVSTVTHVASRRTIAGAFPGTTTPGSPSFPSSSSSIRRPRRRPPASRVPSTTTPKTRTRNAFCDEKIDAKKVLLLLLLESSKSNTNVSLEQQRRRTKEKKKEKKKTPRTTTSEKQTTGGGFSGGGGKRKTQRRCAPRASGMGHNFFFFEFSPVLTFAQYETLTFYSLGYHIGHKRTKQRREVSSFDFPDTKRRDQGHQNALQSLCTKRRLSTLRKDHHHHKNDLSKPRKERRKRTERLRLRFFGPIGDPFFVLKSGEKIPFERTTNTHKRFLLFSKPTFTCVVAVEEETATKEGAFF